MNSDSISLNCVVCFQSSRFGLICEFDHFVCTECSYLIYNSKKINNSSPCIANIFKCIICQNTMHRKPDYPKHFDMLIYEMGVGGINYILFDSRLTNDKDDECSYWLGPFLEPSRDYSHCYGRAGDIFDSSILKDYIYIKILDSKDMKHAYFTVCKIKWGSQSLRPHVISTHGLFSI